LKVRDKSFDSPPDHNDWDFYGIYGNVARGVDLFLLCDWDRKQTDGADQLRRYTAGTNLTWKHKSGFRADADGAFQTGKQARKDLAGYLLALEGSYETKGKLKPKCGIGFDLTSGDDGSDPKKNKSFDNLYYSSHRYRGYMDLFKGTTALGLLDLFVRAGISPVKDLAIQLYIHSFQNMEEYEAAGGGKSQSIGQECDVVAKYTVRKVLEVEAGGAAFFAAEDWKPDADPAFWFYTALAVKL
jgi:hypothetical protein